MKTFILKQRQIKLIVTSMLRLFSLQRPPITTPSPINLILQVWSKSFTTSNTLTHLPPSSLNRQYLSALHKECDSDLTQTILFFHLNSYVRAKHFMIIFILLELL